MMERELDNWLRRAAAQRRVEAERVLADLGLTPAQFAVLAVISEQPGVSAAEIARIERLTPPTLSVIVGNLLRKEVIAKRPHPDNVRIQQLAVTDLGGSMFREGAARLKTTERRLNSSMPVGGEAVVTHWLRAIAESSP